MIMNKKTLETIKKQLLAEKERLEKDLLAFAKKDLVIEDNYKSAFPQLGDTDEENAAEVAIYSDQLSIEHTLEDQLRDAKKALSSIETGAYGKCKYCGKEIEEKRLLARPTSSSCVECKKKLQGE
jgi:RNA polymerase-binding transcription factor DksA